MSSSLGGGRAQGLTVVNSPKPLSCSAILLESPTTAQLCSSGLKYFLPTAEGGKYEVTFVVTKG